MSLWPSLNHKNMLKYVMCTKLNVYNFIFRFFMYFQSTIKKKSFCYLKSFTPYILLTYYGHIGWLEGSYYIINTHMDHSDNIWSDLPRHFRENKDKKVYKQENDSDGNGSNGRWLGELKMYWVFFIPGKLMDLYFSTFLIFL